MCAVVRWLFCSGGGACDVMKPSAEVVNHRTAKARSSPSSPCARINSTTGIHVRNQPGEACPSHRLSFIATG